MDLGGQGSPEDPGGQGSPEDPGGQGSPEDPGGRGPPVDPAPTPETYFLIAPSKQVFFFPQSLLASRSKKGQTLVATLQPRPPEGPGVLVRLTT